MPFKYSCFISYRHVQFGLGKQFMTHFLEALKSHIELELELNEVYLDEERLKGGYLFNQALSDALCHSICMILIFTPTYFNVKKSYCAREYLAMKRLEKRRTKLLNKHNGLIIPIVLKGADALPSEIKNERHFYDFSDYSLATPDILSHPKHNQQIAEIAQYIRKLYQTMVEAGHDPQNECENHIIPSEGEILPWLEELVNLRPQKSLLPFRME